MSRETTDPSPKTKARVIAAAPRLLAAALGIAAALLLSEGAAWLLLGPPPPPDNSFKTCWNSVDIYEPFYSSDGDRYVNRRARSKQGAFPALKSEEEKRVFLVGESAAWFAPEGLLEKKLAALLPGFRWRVVNAGMVGYDSWRILNVAREIVGYRPDLIIVMEGNNDPLPTVRGYPLLHRYPVLARLWVTTALAGALAPARVVGPKDEDDDFRRNLSQLCALAQRRGVPVVLCTLPRNRRWTGLRWWKDREQFSQWWLSSRAPELLPLQGEGEPFWKAAACERLGREDEARRWYDAAFAANGRNAVIRETARLHRGVVLADLEKAVEGFGGEQGYDIFCDGVHFWTPVYDRLFDEIIAAVREGQSLAPAGAWRAPSAGKPWQALLREARGEALASVPARFQRLQVHLKGDQWTISGFIALFRAVRRNCPAAIDACLRLPQPRRTGNEQLDEANACRWMLLGEALREEGEPGKALRCLETALLCGPDNRFALLFHGLCCYDLGLRDRAEKDLETARRQDGEFSWLTVDYLDRLLVRGGKGN